MRASFLVYFVAGVGGRNEAPLAVGQFSEKAWVSLPEEDSERAKYVLTLRGQLVVAQTSRVSASLGIVRSLTCESRRSLITSCHPEKECTGKVTGWTRPGAQEIGRKRALPRRASVRMSTGPGGGREPRVAVVGAGISGLVCARRLAQAGVPLRLPNETRCAPFCRCSSKSRAS